MSLKKIGDYEWFCCPVCGKKLHRIEPGAVCHGVTTFCKQCKWTGFIDIDHTKKGA